MTGLGQQHPPSPILGRSWIFYRLLAREFLGTIVRPSLISISSTREHVLAQQRKLTYIKQGGDWVVALV
eukprot:scaffold247491_cov31-Prasinocladus_malaysianus.AAC.1